MSDKRIEGLSVILAVYNQAPVLEKVLCSWSTLLETLGRPYEILLIDDGSDDFTINLLEGAGDKQGLRSRISHLSVINHDVRRGFGAAVRTGVASARLPLLFYTGCDYAYDPADLKIMLHRIAESDPETGRLIDIVNGYRARRPMRGWRKNLQRTWHLILRVVLDMHPLPRPGWLGAEAHRFALLLRILFGVRIGDIDSKFKLFRRSVLERMPIQSDGDFVHAEILAKANFIGCLMDEMPISEKAGPFPARPEPASPTSRWKELRLVFLEPEFIKVNSPKQSDDLIQPAPVDAI